MADEAVVEQEEVKTGFPYTLTASFVNEEETPATKVEFTDPTPANPATATWSVEWNVGDVIYVANQVGADKTVAYEVESVTAGVATFKLKDGEDVSKFSEGATTYYAGMGGLALTSDGKSVLSHPWYQNSPGGFYTGLPTYKSVTESTIYNDFFLAFGAGTISDGKLNLSFHNYTTYVRMRIPDGMTYDVGEIYFTCDGKSSGFEFVRFSESGISARRAVKNSEGATGGSNNAPFYYGSGTSPLSTPYPKFKPGVYYFPMVPAGNITGLTIYNTSGDVKCARTGFSISRDKGWGKIFDFGTIPTTADD